ncbi:MAG: AraC family transcriptional regulator [Bryobacteraceae bacterium]|nr:AraC family transcriptional regulator [Bryobacteraceae bacterium]
MAETSNKAPELACRRGGMARNCYTPLLQRASQNRVRSIQIVTLTETAHLPRRPGSASSPHKLAAERAIFAPQEIVGVELALTTVHVQQQNQMEFEYPQNGRWIAKTVDPNSITIRPAGSTINVRWKQQTTMVGLALPQSVLRMATPGMATADQLGLEFVCGAKDEEISTLAVLLAKEGERGYPLGELYPEALTMALVLALVKRYGNVRGGRFTDVGGLAGSRMHRVLQYIDAHLADKLSLHQLAQVANVSPFHFSRRFRQATGVSVHQFVLEKRLERARALLKNPSLSLIEVAYASGFSNPSHLSLHFVRRFGCPPGAYRKKIFE